MLSSLVISAFIGSQIINFPQELLPKGLNIFKEYPILNHGLISSDYFHINDVIVLPQYRNKGIGLKLYKKLEKKVRSWGYRGISLCTIEEVKDHPLKPLYYKTPESFWEKLNF